VGAKKGGAARDFEAGDRSGTKKARVPGSLVDAKIVLIVSGSTIRMNPSRCGAGVLIVASGGTTNLDGLIDNI